MRKDVVEIMRFMSEKGSSHPDSEKQRQSMASREEFRKLASELRTSTEAKENELLIVDPKFLEKEVVLEEEKGAAPKKIDRKGQKWR